MDYVKISNSGVLWLLCGVTVIISFVQALIRYRTGSWCFHCYGRFNVFDRRSTGMA